MSYYDDEQPRRHRSHRHSRPVYEEEVIESRQTRPRREPEHMELVRRRDSDDSVEEVRRDFLPGDGTYIQRKTTTRDRYPPRARSVDRRSYYDDEYDDPRRSDPAVSRHTRRRHGELQSLFNRSNLSDSIERRRYDSESEDESPPPRKHHERRKSLSEQALTAVGLGGAAASLAKLRGRHDDRSPSRSPSRDDRRRAQSRSRRGRHEESYSRSRSRTPSRDKSRGGDHKKKLQQAAKAAATAGVIEAWRARKEPGGFKGQGKRILTAAIGAAGIDGAISGKDPDHHSTRHTLEAALGGLAGNRLINGPREQSRSRSKVRGEEGKSGTDIGGVASAAGLAALAGKAFNDYRSKSRGRKENSDDERSPERRSRSRSVSEYITRGVDGAMAKLGLGNPKEHDPRNEPSRSRRRYSSDDDDYYRSRPRGGGTEENQVAKHKNTGDSDDTDSYSSENEVKKQKKLKRKAVLTAGLATVATIHAAANVHGSMEKGRERHKQVREGKMTEEEARKKKSRAILQDAAAVGIAAIGIKSAASEWKELKEKREEYRTAISRLDEKREHRRQKLLRQKSNSQSDGDLHSRYHDEDAYYYRDDNPYTAGVMSPPPMGGYRPSGYH